ncbi:MAG: hypothetical protein U9N85_13300 [Bacteroidota bacterium]|nr:hypothetical protein [Bacteroidota bacterium]
MNQARFIGSRPYKLNEKEFFFGRKSETERMFQHLLIDDSTTLFGESGTGKTSLLNAGLVPLLKDSGRFEIIKISLSACNDISFIEHLEGETNRRFNQPFYLDKIVSSKEHIWYHLKKIQANSSKIIALVIDGLDRVFSESDNMFSEFTKQVQSVVNKETPEIYRKDVEKAADSLSPKGKELLDAPLDVKFVFSADSSAKEQVNSLAEACNFNLKSIVNISHFKRKKAAEIIRKTAGFKPQYQSAFPFESPMFNIETKAVESILSTLENQKDRIKPVVLQAIGMGYEQEAIEKEITNFSEATNITVETALKTFHSKEIKSRVTSESYNTFLSELADKDLESIEIHKNSIPDGFCNALGLLFGINKTTDGNFQMNFKSEFIKNSIKASDSSQKNKKNDNPTQGLTTNSGNRTLKIYKIAVVVLFAASVFGLFMMNKARKRADKNRRLASSNMYAAYSYKALESDPTLSFRYAQKAYELFPENDDAYSALLNAYYNTEVFYSTLSTLPEENKEAVLSPSGKLVMSASYTPEKKSTVFIHTSEGKKVDSFQTANPVYFMQFNDSGEKAYFADIKGNFFIYSIETSKIRPFKLTESRIIFADLKANGNLLILSEEEGVLLYKGNYNEAISLPGGDYPYDMACLSENSELIAAVSDKLVNLFSSNGELMNSITLPIGAGINFPRVSSMKFSPNSKQLLVTVNDMLTKSSLVIRMDIGGRLIYKYGGHKEWINTADFSKDGQLVVTSGYDKISVVLDKSGNELGILKGHKAVVSDAVFAGNNETVITVCDDGRVRQWKFGKLMNPLAEIKNINSIRFAPTGLSMLTSNNNSLKILNIFGETLTEFNTENKSVQFAEFSKNEKFIYTINKAGELIFWHTSGEIFKKIKSNSKLLRSADYQSDSSLVISQENDTSLLLFNFDENTLRQKISSDHRINTFSFSPDGTKIITAEESGEVIVRDLYGGIISKYKNHKSGAIDVNYSPQGKMTVSTGKDRKVILRDSHGNLINEFKGYDSKINTAEFSPDGKYILTASDDNKVKLYTITGKLIGKISYPGKVRSASFSSGGDYILASYILNGRIFSKLQHISADIILEYVNKDKVFGNIQEFELQ